MKLSKWMTISTAALALAGGILTADADSMVLSGGEKLDLGEKVSVFDGKRSFFGSQLHDWLMEDKAVTTVEEAIKKENLFPKNEAYSHDVAQMAVDVLRRGKLYQVRSEDKGICYQGMVVSIALSDADEMKLALYSAALDTQSKKAVKDNQAEAKELVPLLAMAHGQLTVKAHSDWADKTSKKGLAYSTGSAQISIIRDGFTLPVYLKAIIHKDKGMTTYTLLAADQASGAYLSLSSTRRWQELKNETHAFTLSGSRPSSDGRNVRSGWYGRQWRSASSRTWRERQHGGCQSHGAAADGRASRTHAGEPGISGRWKSSQRDDLYALSPLRRSTSLCGAALPSREEAGCVRHRFRDGNERGSGRGLFP